MSTRIRKEAQRIKGKLSEKEKRNREKRKIIKEEIYMMMK